MTDKSDGPTESRHDDMHSLVLMGEVLGKLRDTLSEHVSELQRHHSAVCARLETHPAMNMRTMLMFDEAECAADAVRDSIDDLNKVLSVPLANEKLENNRQGIKKTTDHLAIDVGNLCHNLYARKRVSMAAARLRRSGRKWPCTECATRSEKGK